MSLFANRPRLIHASLALFAGALVLRAGYVQLYKGAHWRALARGQQVAAAPLPAPRGPVLDANGEVLVESREMVQLRIAPNQVRERAKLAKLMGLAGIGAEWIAKVGDSTLKWMEIPGLFLPTDVAMITAMRGVHPTPVLNRVAPPSDGLRRIIGRTADGGVPVDGVEMALDALLRGQAGSDALLKDSKGRLFASPAVAGRAARPGHRISLTINAGLQDIAERALDDAVARQGAQGGDIVILDANNGEIRALATHRRDPRSTAATALTEPYEPGSTLKPFYAAWLLDHKRARPDEVMNTFGGRWKYNGRLIVDDHPAGALSLADVIRFSSNIGIIQFAQRLNAREQYELMRDVGFGTPTGASYPSESPGRLAPPALWSQQTPASMAMGYEIMVTPLQLATAYAAIANGGELLQPTLIKEVRAPDGSLRYRHERRVVRRVMSVEAAREMRSMLKGVVDAGTAAGSALATFELAGKTGTAKVAANHRYLVGEYTASFVGMFPAESPQIVILVKLDRPQKDKYGGKAAAPVSKTILEAAIAARDAALDRQGLAEAAPRVAPPVNAAHGVASAPSKSQVTTPVVARAAAAERLVPDSPTVVVDTGSVPYEMSLEHPLRPSRIVAGARPVPSVQGLSSRAAARVLHRAGFRVQFARGVNGQSPAAGTLAASGSRVTVEQNP